MKVLNSQNKSVDTDLKVKDMKGKKIWLDGSIIEGTQFKG